MKKLIAVILALMLTLTGCAPAAVSWRSSVMAKSSPSCSRQRERVSSASVSRWQSSAIR